MLADFVKSLVGLAEKARTPQLLEIPNSPEKRLLFYGDMREEIEIPLPTRKHKVSTLDSFLEAVSHYHDEALKTADKTPALVIWIGEQTITALLDDDTRRDQITLPLLPSEVFTAVQTLGEPMQQRQLVNLLREELINAAPASLLTRVRKVEATMGATTKGEITHGKEKGVSEFQAELVGASEIPESIELNVPIYGNVPTQAETIACAVSFTMPPNPITFTISPLPDQITLAVQNTQRQLKKLLEDSLGEAKIPVFLGTP